MVGKHRSAAYPIGVTAITVPATACAKFSHDLSKQTPCRRPIPGRAAAPAEPPAFTKRSKFATVRASHEVAA